MNVMKEIIDTTETIVRHLVCEEIRQEATQRAGIDYEWMTMTISLEDLVDILDQIEKGE